MAGHMEDDILTALEVSRMLRVEHGSVTRWAKQGRLKGFKVGSDWRFTRAAVQEFIKASTPEPKPPKKVEGLAVEVY